MFLHLAFIFNCTDFPDPHSKTVQELEKILFKDYDKDVVPKRFPDKGLKVLVDLALYQIKDVVRTTSFPGSSLSREKDPGWVWSRGTQILGGDK